MFQPSHRAQQGPDVGWYCLHVHLDQGALVPEHYQLNPEALGCGFVAAVVGAKD